MNNSQEYNICLYLNDPIKIEIHEHPLILCITPDRKNYGTHWTCNNCKTDYFYEIPSFYCTYCDFDLCPKCLGAYKLNEIMIYNYNIYPKFAQNLDKTFEWQKKFLIHEHMLTMIEKLNKNYNWKCKKCSKEYNNNNSLFYCSLCNYYICQACINNNNINNDFKNILKNPNPININLPILNNNDIFQIRSFKVLNNMFPYNNNLIFCPLPIQILFTLLSNGITPGNALNEITNALSIIDLKNQNNYFINIFSNLQSNISLKIANAILLNSNLFHLGENFKNYLYKYSTKFTNNIYEINNFISQKTDHKVNNYFNLNDIKENDLILTNVLYFNGLWKKKFEPCRNLMPFYLSNGQIQNIKMMVCETNFNYYNDNSIEAIEIPYQSNYNSENISAIIILPNKSIKLNGLINHLTQEKLNVLYNNFKNNEVKLTMPKFKFWNNNERMDLIPMLSNIGIKEIFEFSDQNFIPMVGNNTFKISKVFQTNLLDVDENGTQLISFISVEGFFGSSLPQKKISMTVDRPFLFLIRNKNYEVGKDLILISKIENI